MIYVYQAGLPDEDGFRLITVGSYERMSGQMCLTAGDFIEYTRSDWHDSSKDHNVLAVVANAIYLQDRDGFIVVGDAIGTVDSVAGDIGWPDSFNVNPIEWPYGAAAELEEVERSIRAVPAVPEAAID